MLIEFLSVETAWIDSTGVNGSGWVGTLRKC